MLKKSSLKQISNQLASIVQYLHNGNLNHRRAIGKREAPTLQQWHDLLNRYCSETAVEWRVCRERWTGVSDDAAVLTWCHEDAARARFWRIVAVLAFMFEATFAASIARFWLSVPILLVVPIAVSLAGIFTWFCEARWTASSDEAIPEVEYQRAKKAITVLISLVLLSIASFLATRMLALGAMVLVAVQAALSILLPLIAGGAFYIAKLTGFSNMLVKRHREAESVLLRVDAALDDVNSLMAGTDQTGSQATPDESLAPEPHGVSARRVVAAFAVVVMVSLGIPRNASAGAASAPQRLDLWIDVSGSLDQRELLRIARVISESAEWLSPFREVALFGFADEHDALAGPVAILSIPELMPFRCSVSPDDGIARYLLAAQRKRESECRVEERATVERFRKQAADFVVRFNGAISALVSNRTGAKKTCVYQVIRRAQLASKNTTSIVITDGMQFNCRGTIPAFSQPRRTRSIVVIVPSRGTDDGLFSNAMKRIVSLRRLFPTIELHASYEIDEPGALQRVLMDL